MADVVCEGGWWPPGEGEPGTDWGYEAARRRCGPRRRRARAAERNQRAVAVGRDLELFAHAHGERKGPAAS